LSRSLRQNRRKKGFDINGSKPKERTGQKENKKQKEEPVKEKPEEDEEDEI
jgi:hypothetical protein